MKNRTSFLMPLILLAVRLSGPPSLSAQTTLLYQTGFQVGNWGNSWTACTNGPVVSQDGWQSGLSYSQNAGQIVGFQNVMEIFGPWVSNSGGSGYNSIFLHPLTNYNPVAAGTPVISVSADMLLNLGPTASQASYVYGWLVLKDQFGTDFESIGICANGVVCAQNFASPNQVVTAPGNGTDTYHILRADLNFSSRQVTFYMDGVSFGSMPFNPNSGNLVSSVALYLQSSNPIDSNLLVESVRVTAGQQIPSKCSIQITGAGPCLANGSPGVPYVGDNYGVYVDFSVTGISYQPFRIKYTVGNLISYSDYSYSGSSQGYLSLWSGRCDGPLLWSVTIDPDGIRGSSTPAEMTQSGTFIPTPPSQAVALYDTITMAGEGQFSLTIPSGGSSGFWMVLGCPTSHGAQKVESLTGPPNATIAETTPNGVPVCSKVFGAVGSGVMIQETETYVVELSNMKVNPTTLRTVTWAQMSALPASITPWLASDTQCEAGNAQISAFIYQYLPANYQATMTPYDTARTLQRAVARSLIYIYPPPTEDAVTILATRQGDCGGYAALLTAALRTAGIPARRISGFWNGDGWPNRKGIGGHVRVEFYLPFPVAGWLIADSDLGHSCDPTSIYSPDFCFVPDASGYIALDTGDAHNTASGSFNELQMAQCTYWPKDNYSWNVYLEPLAVLGTPSVSGANLVLPVTNMPWDGTVSLQESKSLSSTATWTTVQTLSYGFVENNSGNNYTFKVPLLKTGGEFFRLAQGP